MRTRYSTILSGSSPLARGLQRAAFVAEAVGRIIPARAGFTRVHLILVDGAGDHPRSRGVYVVAVVAVG